MKMNPKLHLVVLNKDTLALNMTRSLALDIQILVADDMADYGRLIQAHFGAIGIVQIDLGSDQAELAGRISIVQTLIGKHANSRFLAVGSPNLAKFGRELLISGFASVFCSFVDIDRMTAVAVRHHKTVAWPDQSIEEAVAKNLPWQMESRER